MSFILEALKKSEKQQQKKNGQVVRTVYEPVPAKRFRSRSLAVILLVLLFVNGVVLLWLFSPWQTTTPVGTAAKTPSSAQNHQLPQAETKGSATLQQPVENNRLMAEKIASQAVKATSPQAVVPLPVTRSEKKVYLFSQLPLAVQKRIPTLKMSLHAYNREQSSASLIQLNDRILREGDQVTDHIRLEQITADGAVLRYDGYRFLLTRRGHK